MKNIKNSVMILLVAAAFAVGGLEAMAQKCEGTLELTPLNVPRHGDQSKLKFVAPEGEGRGSGAWIGVFQEGKPTKPQYLVTWMFLTSTDCVERFYLPVGTFEAYMFSKDVDRSGKSYGALTDAVKLSVRPKE